MLKFSACSETVKKHVEISVCSENCKKACWKFQNSSSEVVRSRCTSRFSSTQHSEIFWNIRKLYERYLLQFKRYFTIQMFRIFNFVKFLKRSTPDAHPDDWVWNIRNRAVADPGFSPGGAPTPKIAIIFHIFAENCMKMKEFGPPGGARVPGAPPWIHQCRDQTVYA